MNARKTAAPPVPLMHNAEMSESGIIVPPSEARAVIGEILNLPEMNFDKKPHRMRPFLEHLQELYLKSPKARTSERELMEKFYKELNSDDAAKKVIARLRNFLDECWDRLPPSRWLRVRIPKSDYRLVFYEKFVRYDEDPVNWFWRAYVERSLPLRVAFVHPGVRWHRKGFAPQTTIRLYRSLLNVTGGEAPEPISLHHNGAAQKLAEPQHKIILSSVPQMDSVSTQFWYARRDLKLYHWDPARVLEDGNPYGPVVMGRMAIIGPEPAGSETYEDDGQTVHVLVTRFTFPDPPHPQLTILSSSEPRALEHVMTTLTDRRKLFHVVTAKPLDDTKLDQSKAPAIFQMVFRVRKHPSRSQGVLKELWSEPELLKAAVFAKTPNI